MQKYKVHAGLILVGIIYGANHSIAKEVMPLYIPAYGFTLLRISAACLLFWLYPLFFKSREIDLKKNLPRLLLCAFLGVAANQLFSLKGLSLTSPINAALITTVTPVLVLLASAVLLKESLSVKKGVGVALGLAGAAMLVLQRGSTPDQGGVLGDALVMLSATAYGFYLVVVRPLMHENDAAAVIRWIFLFGFFMVLPFGWQDLSSVQWQEIPLPIWLAILYVILFTTFIAYLLNVWTLRWVSSSVVGMYIYLQPVVTTLMATLLGQDRLTLDKIVFSALIFTGVYLVSRK